jgi:fermentation-respiration switch protein FrsA (DUF1100 family)
MQTEFRFRSDGESLVGNLFLPSERTKPAGVVVAVGPLTSVKEQAAGGYAQAMAARGYAALAFDYRYLGESGGRPRQSENPAANTEDIKNAATALLADDRLTGRPLFGLGICFGAGPMVRSVAEDARFRAFAGVAGLIAIAVLGLGFGKVSQVLVVAVQNGVEQRRIGVATAATTFFRGLGGAVGATALGAVFAAHAAGVHASQVGEQALGHAARAAVVDGVR